MLKDMFPDSKYHLCTPDQVLYMGHTSQSDHGENPNEEIELTYVPGTLYILPLNIGIQCKHWLFLIVDIENGIVSLYDSSRHSKGSRNKLIKGTMKMFMHVLELPPGNM